MLVHRPALGLGVSVTPVAARVAAAIAAEDPELIVAADGEPAGRPAGERRSRAPGCWAWSCTPSTPRSSTRSASGRSEPLARCRPGRPLMSRLRRTTAVDPMSSSRLTESPHPRCVEDGHGSRSPGRLGHAFTAGSITPTTGHRAWAIRWTSRSTCVESASRFTGSSSTAVPASGPCGRVAGRRARALARNTSCARAATAPALTIATSSVPRSGRSGRSSAARLSAACPSERQSARSIACAPISSG